MFSTDGLILAPAMLWGWVFYHSHRYKQTRLLLLLLLFAGGFLSGPADRSPLVLLIVALPRSLTLQSH